MIYVGVGGLAATNTPGEIIKTLALGSCVAVVCLHPQTRTVGMVHVALPDSSISFEKAQVLPGYFADTGIPALLQSMARLGCEANGRSSIFKLVGGAKVMDQNDTFHIGERNVRAIKEILWQLGLETDGEEVGGFISRSVAAIVDTGQVIITSFGRPDWEI